MVISGYKISSGPYHLENGSSRHAKGRSQSDHHLDSIHSPVQPTYLLDYSVLLSQKCYALSLGAFQTSLYMWYSLTTLETTNARTALALHMMIK